MLGKKVWISSERWLRNMEPGDDEGVLLYEAESSLLTAKNKGSTPMRGQNPYLRDLLDSLLFEPAAE